MVKSTGKGNLTMKVFRFITCAAMAALVAGCSGFATKGESLELRKKTDELRQNLTDSNNRLDEMSNKFSLLREKVEEQKIIIERLSSSVPAVPEGLRVVALGGTGSKDAVLKDTAADAAPKKIQKQGPPVKSDAPPEIRHEGAAEQTRGAAKAEAVKTEAVPSGKEGQTDQVAMYDRGRELFMAGKSEAAREVFLEFVKRFPSSKLANNAFYWIGESYYSEKDFERALEKFRQIVSLYPNENKAPDAMLKAGMALTEMNEPNKAKDEFEALVKRYPDSEAAVKAKKILAKDSGKARKK